MADQSGQAEHPGMPVTPLVTPPLEPEPEPEALLAEVIGLDLPRLALPRTCGGEGADIATLASAVQALARRQPAAALLAWSQCLLAEALARSPNVALREHLLPDLLDGSLAGAVSWSLDFGLVQAPWPVKGRPRDRGWHLSGRLLQVPNLQWAGHVLLCPVWFEPDGPQAARLGWALLRSEEDGLRHALDSSRALTRQAACGTVTLQRVHFREDELLADDAGALALPLRLFDQALRSAWWAGVLQRPTARTHDGSPRP